MLVEPLKEILSFTGSESFDIDLISLVLQLKATISITGGSNYPILFNPNMLSWTRVMATQVLDWDVSSSGNLSSIEAPVSFPESISKKFVKLAAVNFHNYMEP